MKNSSKQIKEIETKFMKSKHKIAYGLMIEPETISQYIQKIVDYSDSKILNKLALDLADLIIPDNSVCKKSNLLAHITKRNTVINNCIIKSKDAQLHFYESILNVCFRYIFLNANKSDIYKYLNTIKAPIVKPIKEFASVTRDFLEAIDKDSTATNDEEFEYQGFTVEEIATEIIADKTDYNNDFIDYTGDAEGGYEFMCSSEGEDNWCAWFWATGFINSFMPSLPYIKFQD